MCVCVSHLFEPLPPSIGPKSMRSFASIESTVESVKHSISLRAHFMKTDSAGQVCFSQMLIQDFSKSSVNQPMPALRMKMMISLVLVRP